jgi:nucleolar protein TMA23
MDSSAYLTRHGWLGDGHALHPGGIKKPLLVSKKANVLGLGKKKNDAHADQWWARAFDSGLKNLEIGQVAKDSSNEPFKGRSRSTLE